MSENYLMRCGRCRWIWLERSPADTCVNCHSREATAPTILDPANPSRFSALERGEISVPASRPVWEGIPGIQFDWGTFDRPTVYPTVYPGSASASNAHVSETVLWGESLTLEAVEQTYNRAVRGMRDAGVDAATASRLTQEWKRPEPKPPQSERLEFPTDRKITVK